MGRLEAAFRRFDAAVEGIQEDLGEARGGGADADQLADQVGCRDAAEDAAGGVLFGGPEVGDEVDGPAVAFEIERCFDGEEGVEGAAFVGGDIVFPERCGGIVLAAEEGLRLSFRQDAGVDGGDGLFVGGFV